MLVAEVGEEPAVAHDVAGEGDDAEYKDRGNDPDDDVAALVIPGGVVGWCIHQVRQGHWAASSCLVFVLRILDTEDRKSGCAGWLTPPRGSRFGTGKGVAEELEFGAVGKEIDGENIKAQRDGGAIGLGELAEVGGGHFAEHLLLMEIDRRFGRGQAVRCARLDFEDNERGTVPGDEVEVAGNAGRAPAARDDGVAEGAKMKESSVFAALAGKEMLGKRGFLVGKGADGSIGARFEREYELMQAHAGRIAH